MVGRKRLAGHRRRPLVVRNGGIGERHKRLPVGHHKERLVGRRHGVLVGHRKGRLVGRHRHPPVGRRIGEDQPGSQQLWEGGKLGGACAVRKGAAHKGLESHHQGSGSGWEWAWLNETTKEKKHGEQDRHELM